MLDFDGMRHHMIQGQILPVVALSDTLHKALSHLQRELCVPEANRAMAYCDQDVMVGEGRFLLSPCAFVRLVQAAQIAPHDNVLDVGSATGYTSAVLSYLAHHVTGLERSDTLIATAKSFIAHHHISNVAFISKNPLEGFAERTPYDVIIVEGCLEQIPMTLLSQLREDGRLVTFMKAPAKSVCEAVFFTKTASGITQQSLFEIGASALRFEADCDNELEISVQQLAQRLKTTPAPLILDVREPQELRLAAFPDATSVPLDTLEHRYHELDPSKEIYTLCHHGMRSLRACCLLRGKGFDKVSSIKGGIDEWSRLIDPAVPTY